MMIPRCMSSQHPDNAAVPFFASSSVLAGEDEIKEAYYVFSHLGCDEQMWDVLSYVDMEGPLMTDSLPRNFRLHQPFCVRRCGWRTARTWRNLRPSQRSL